MYLVYTKYIKGAVDMGRPSRSYASLQVFSFSLLEIGVLTRR